MYSSLMTKTTTILIKGSAVQALFPLSILILSAFLAACAPSTVNIRDPLTTVPQSSEPGFGVVVARVIHTDSRGAPFNYLRLEPSNVNASADIKSEEMKAITRPLSSGSFFVSNIPVGTYSLSYVRTYYYDGQFYISKWVKGGIDIGTVEVKEGELTDLGQLIYYPKSEGDIIKNTLSRIPNSHNAELLKILRPEISNAYLDVNQWNEDGGDSDRQNFFSAAVQNPVAFNTQFHDIKTNKTYFAGKLGFILSYSGDGEWQQDAIDTNDEIYAVAVSPNGTLFVGGEYGALYSKSPGDAWKKIAYDDKYTIKDIVADDDDSITVLGVDLRSVNLSKVSVVDTTQNQTIGIYDLNYGWGSASGEWHDKERELEVNTKKQKAIELEERTGKKKNRAERRYIKYAFRENIDNQIHYFVGIADPYQNEQSPLHSVSKRETHLYTPSNGVFTKVLDFGSGVDHVNQSGTELVGTKRAGFWSWDGKDTFVKRSKEAPYTWEKITRTWDKCPEQPEEATLCPNPENAEKPKKRKKTINFASQPYFWDESEGIVFGTWVEANFWASTTETKTAVFKTTNGGKTWVALAEEWPGKYCSGLIPEVQDVLLVSCNGISSDFYESKDRGLTWSLVRETENF